MRPRALIHKGDSEEQVANERGCKPDSPTGEGTLSSRCRQRITPSCWTAASAEPRGISPQIEKARRCSMGPHGPCPSPPRLPLLDSPRIDGISLTNRGPLPAAISFLSLTNPTC